MEARGLMRIQFGGSRWNCMEASMYASVQASVGTYYVEVSTTSTFRGSFHYRASMGACITSIEASTNFINFHGSFHVLPSISMKASVYFSPKTKMW